MSLAHISSGDTVCTIGMEKDCIAGAIYPFSWETEMKETKYPLS